MRITHFITALAMATFAANPSTATAATGISAVEGDKITEGIPGVQASIEKCQIFGENVRVDLLFTNLTSKDIHFVLYGSWYNIPRYKAKFIDKDGNSYQGQISIGGQNPTHIEQEYTLPAGCTVRGYAMIEDVPETVKSMQHIDIRASEGFMQEYTYRLDVHGLIVDPLPGNGPNIYCNLPWLAVENAKFVRKGKEVIATFNLKNTTDRAFPCTLDQMAGYLDVDGEAYSDISLSVNNTSYDSVKRFEPGVPVKCELTISNVPLSVKKISNLNNILTLDGYKYLIQIQNMDIVTVPTQSATKSSAKGTTTRRTATQRRR